MSKDNTQPKTEVKETKEAEKKAVVPKKKEEKPKMLQTSKMLFRFCDEGRTFAGGVDEVVTTLMGLYKAAGQTHNIKNKPITKENQRSQTKSWMADVNSERTGDWAKCELKDDEKSGLTFGKRA